MECCKVKVVNYPRKILVVFLMENILSWIVPVEVVGLAAIAMVKQTIDWKRIQDAHQDIKGISTGVSEAPGMKCLLSVHCYFHLHMCSE